MAMTRKGITMSGCTAILAIAACLTLSVVPAGAETMKFTLTNVVTKGESYAVGDEEGHELIFMVRDGVATLQNGEAASMKGYFVSNSTRPRGGSFLGYQTLKFGDGSTIVFSIQPGTFSADPERKVLANQQASGELLSGSGRFKGIKGTVSMTGTLLKMTKEDIYPKAYNDFTLTYTLP